MNNSEYVSKLQAEINCTIQSIFEKLNEKEQKMCLDKKGVNHEPNAGDPFIYECICNYLFILHTQKFDHNRWKPNPLELSNHKIYGYLFGICQLLDSTDSKQMEFLPYLLTAYVYNTHCFPPKSKYLNKIDSRFSKKSNLIQHSQYSPYEMKKQIFFGLDVGGLNDENAKSEITGDVSAIFLSHLSKFKNIRLFSERFHFHTIRDHCPPQSKIPIFKLQSIDNTVMLIPDEKFDKLNGDKLGAAANRCLRIEQISEDPIAHSFDSHIIWGHYQNWCLAIYLALEGKPALKHPDFIKSADLLRSHFYHDLEDIEHSYSFERMDEALNEVKEAFQEAPDEMILNEKYISPFVSKFIIESFNGIDVNQLSVVTILNQLGADDASKAFEYIDASCLSCNTILEYLTSDSMIKLIDSIDVNELSQDTVSKLLASGDVIELFDRITIGFRTCNRIIELLTPGNMIRSSNSRDILQQPASESAIKLFDKINALCAGIDESSDSNDDRVLFDTRVKLFALVSVITLFRNIKVDLALCGTISKLQNELKKTTAYKVGVPIFKSDYIALRQNPPIQDRARYPSKKERVSGNVVSFRQYVDTWPIELDLTPYYPKGVDVTYKTCTIIPVFGKTKWKYSYVEKRLNKQAQKIFPLYANTYGSSIIFEIVETNLSNMKEAHKGAYKPRWERFPPMHFPLFNFQKKFKWGQRILYFPFTLKLPKKYSQVTRVKFYACYDLSEKDRADIAKELKHNNQKLPKMCGQIYLQSGCIEVTFI